MSSDRSQSRSLGTPVRVSLAEGVGVKRSLGHAQFGPFWRSGPVVAVRSASVQAASGSPTTWVWAPRAWVTPIVRSEAPIIGRL